MICVRHFAHAAIIFSANRSIYRLLLYFQVLNRPMETEVDKIFGGILSNGFAK